MKAIQITAPSEMKVVETLRNPLLNREKFL